MARYRLRTELRSLLPERFEHLVPRGSRNCGTHDWYRADAYTDRCYHCVVGERPHLEKPAEPEPGEDESPHTS